MTVERIQDDRAGIERLGGRPRSYRSRGNSVRLARAEVHSGQPSAARRRFLKVRRAHNGKVHVAPGSALVGGCVKMPIFLTRLGGHYATRCVDSSWCPSVARRWGDVNDIHSQGGRSISDQLYGPSIIEDGGARSE